jgi:hypothetical protein
MQCGNTKVELGKTDLCLAYLLILSTNDDMVSDFGDAFIADAWKLELE